MMIAVSFTRFEGYEAYAWDWRFSCSSFDMAYATAAPAPTPMSVPMIARVLISFSCFECDVGLVMTTLGVVI